jgi:hypothetical protein
VRCDRSVAVNLGGAVAPRCLDWLLPKMDLSLIDG